MGHLTQINLVLWLNNFSLYRIKKIKKKKSPFYTELIAAIEIYLSERLTLTEI